jgi:proteic killer suppression protein
MDFRFKDKKLEQLYTEEKDARFYPPAVVNRFFELMAIIDGAPDEREFYRLKSLHFEKLRGKRENQYSMRLNKQYRLIMTLETDAVGRYVLVVEISDHYKK